LNVERVGDSLSTIANNQKKCQQECKSFFCQMHPCVLTCSQSTTSVSSDAEMSVPWTRTSLLNTPTYVASPGFLSQVVWTKSSNQNDLVNATTDSETTDAPSSRATCAVVGCVSPNRLFLEPHGNYNPSFENTALETSKAQFQLVSPTIHPEFDIDFNHGIKNNRKHPEEGVQRGTRCRAFCRF